MQQAKLPSKQPGIQVSLHVPAMKMHEWDSIFGQPMSAEQIESIRTNVKNRVCERNSHVNSNMVWG